MHISGVISTLKGGLQAFPNRMTTDIKYTQTCCLKKPSFFTEDGKITPLSLYGKSPKCFTHLGHPCVMV